MTTMYRSFMRNDRTGDMSYQDFPTQHQADIDANAVTSQHWTGFVHAVEQGAPFDKGITLDQLQEADIHRLPSSYESGEQEELRTQFTGIMDHLDDVYGRDTRHLADEPTTHYHVVAFINGCLNDYDSGPYDDIETAQDAAAELAFGYFGEGDTYVTHYHDTDPNRWYVTRTPESHGGYIIAVEPCTEPACMDELDA